MKRYVVGFIFNDNMKYVLMLKRNKHPYAGCYNGIGGKIEAQDDSLDKIDRDNAMMREMAEETPYTMDDVEHITYMMTIQFPSQIELNVYYIKLISMMEYKPLIDINEGELEWVEVDDDMLNVTSTKYAGEGNIPYFINYALILEKIKKGG